MMSLKLLLNRRLIGISLSIASLTSCSLFDTSEIIPSYIHIDKITFVPGDTNIQGSSSTNITDAWVYIDDHAVGCYELPVTFPVQYEGVHSIKIAAGIKMNGIAATRVAYPFYDFYDGTVTLTPKQTTQVNPTVKYFPGVSFPYVDYFTNSTQSDLDTVGNTGAGIQYITGPLAFWGGPSAYIRLGGDTISFMGQTRTTYLLNADGHGKFIELNYKCNHPFVVGLTRSGSPIPILGLNPSDNWNKVYINLTDYINLNGSYGIYIAMQKLGTDTETPELFLDNLKLVHN
jgi:hypothetical protein